MSLQEQLTQLKEENLAKFPEEIKSIMIDDLNKLSASGLIEAAPNTGDTLKDFSLPNYRGELSSLAVLRKKGPVVVTFYRGGWCPYCNLELRAYQEILPQIKAAEATLVAITPELPDESLTTSERHALEFEVLTDKESEYAREIGVVFTVAEKLRPIYESFGIDLEKHNGKGQFDVPLAATYVVDVDGTIVYAVVEADYTIRAEPAEVVKVLKSLAK
jgi:peroxiredoxin